MAEVRLMGSVAGFGSLGLRCRPRHLASSDGSNGMVPISLPKGTFPAAAETDRIDALKRLTRPANIA